MLKTKSVPKIYKVMSNFRITYTITFMGVDEVKVFRQRDVDSLPLVNKILSSYVGTQYNVKSIDKIEKF